MKKKPKKPDDTKLYEKAIKQIDAEVLLNKKNYLEGINKKIEDLEKQIKELKITQQALK